MVDATDAAASLSSAATATAAATPPVGAGVVAAGVAELSAGLCESIAHACACSQARRAAIGARGGEEGRADSAGAWEGAAGAAVQASILRRRAARAARANADAYTAARDALKQPGDPVPGGDRRLRERLTASAETLLEIVAVAVDCATLAAEVASRCAPGLRADAAGAAELAAAAGHSAASLVEVNLGVGAADERRRRAQALVALAVGASQDARRAVLD